jgi:hypothetical protein
MPYKGIPIEAAKPRATLVSRKVKLLQLLYFLVYDSICADGVAVLMDWPRVSVYWIKNIPLFFRFLRQFLFDEGSEAMVEWR